MFELASVGIAHRVRNRALQQPARPAFTGITFSGRSDHRSERLLTIGELDARASAVAREMRRTAQRGDRALLLYRHGVDFVIGFLACLYAGVIAVPAPLPRQGIGRERLLAIVADAAPRLVLTSGELTEPFDESISRLRTDLIKPDGGKPFAIKVGDADVALLQYSSGTAGEAKGVAVTHANLAHQARVICEALKPSADDSAVSWLPLYHDMGLITGVVMPLHVGLHGWLMSPDAFVARPGRWLKCISDARAAYCVAPDFAYAHCVQRSDDDELRDLDLSCIRFAVNGAEPVRASTIEAFAARFDGSGFRADAFYPAYGLAEGTLLVAGSTGGARLRSLDASGVAAGALSPAVSCGRAILDIEIRIVDRVTHAPCNDGETGEIWVRGGSVAAGYWRREAQSQDIFAARLADGSGPWMRTGDTGVLHEGELFVRGRVKDLMKVRGQGVHPEDIESVLSDAHPDLPSGIAVFSMDDGRSERVVVVQEIGRGASRRVTPRAALDAMLACSARNGLLHVDEIVLVERALPRTTSGKVMRGEVRSRHAAGSLGTVESWRRGAGGGANDDIGYHLAWIGDHLEAVLGRRPAPAEGFRDAGVDAEIHRGLIHRLQTLIGVQAPHSELMAFTTSQHLAAHLAAEYGRGERPGAVQTAHLGTAGADAGGSVPDEPVAIIGMACRFPGADGVEQFWSNLCAGVDAVDEVPAERWEASRLFDANPLSTGKMSTRFGGFLEGIDRFDRKFFGMSARESASTDPAHRLMMELGWEALEDAGIPASSLDGSQTGVYVGISGCDYSHLQFGDDAMADAYAGLGCALTNAASRVSYMLNLRGPALAIDAACSSSLGALHVAAAAVRSGEVGMALAGGVNIIIAPSVTMSLSKAGMMAPDGRCKTFDQRANGYVRAEGAGLVLLKPLSRALADGDHVYAVVRGTASNQDGRSSSLSAPNGDAQQRVVMEACRRAGIAPSDYTYVEAHGTGTPIGDPIELNALGELLRASGKPAAPVMVGSVKTNIGHAESAAGIASVIKTALVLHHRRIPGNLHFETPNPLIRFDDFDLCVPTATTQIPEAVARPLAGVNGFGIGGTNVHAVLQGIDRAALQAVRGESRIAPWTIPVTARSEEALRNNLAALAEYLEARPELDPRDLVATLVQRRDAMPRRAVVCAFDRDSAIEAMRAYAADGNAPAVISGQLVADAPRVGFVYSGQGTQWWAMGRALYAAGGVFRESIDACASLLDPGTGWSLVTALHADEDCSPLDQTGYAQPALFALQYALGRHLQTLGLTPDVVVGHSLGEIAAAEAAGLLSLGEACRLVAARGALMQEITGGGLMASVELPANELASAIASYGDRLAVAASNGPTTSVLSGDADAVSEMLAQLTTRGVATVRLDVNYAFHSPQTAPLVDRLRAASDFIAARQATRPFYSTVDARRMEELDADYWARNMRHRVCFQEAVEAMTADGVNVFVEISPHAVLSGAINRILTHGSVRGSVIPTLQRNIPDEMATVRALSVAWVAGGHDWRALVASDAFLRDVPRYGWDRQRYWLDGAHRQLRDRYSAHPLLGHRVPGAQPIWEAHADANRHPWLDGMRLFGEAVLPLAVGIELALEAGREATDGASVTLRAVRVAPPTGAAAGALLHVALHDDGPGERRVVVDLHAEKSSGKLAGWEPAFSAKLEARRDAHAGAAALGRHALATSGDTADKAEVYRLLGEVGLSCSAGRQPIARCWRGAGGVVVSLEAELVASAPGFCMPYAVVDAVEQAARLAAGASVTMRVVAIAAVHLGGSLADARFVSCRARRHGGDGADWIADAWVTDADGTVLAVFDAISMSEVRQGAHARVSADAHDWRCSVDWLEQPLQSGRQAEGRGWVIVPDTSGAADDLRDALAGAGARVELVDAGPALQASAAAGVQTFAQALQAAIDGLRADGTELAGLVDMSPLDCRRAAGPDAGAPTEAEFAVAYRTIQLVQAANRVESRVVPRLWTVSRRARAVVAGDPCDSPMAAMAWGASRSILIEHRELRCTCVDADADDAIADASSLASELLADDVADQIAYRGGRRFVGALRYDRHAPGAVASDASGQGRLAYALARDSAGEVVAQPFHRPWARAAECLLRVTHADAGAGAARMSLCVGTVESVGADVAGLSAGARVVCLGDMPLASHVLVDSRLAVPLAAGVAPDMVAALPAAMEALIALRGHGGLQRGSSVLVRDLDGHGVTAVAVARHLGLRVYAIVSPALRDTYAQLKLAGVFDAYDPGADDGLRGAAQGGVDVLLDVSGGWIRGGARAVRARGRIALLAGTRCRTTLDPPANVSVETVDLAAMMRDIPDQVRLLAVELLRLVEQGGSLSAHAGAQREDAGLYALPGFPELETGASGLHADASYLITGGLGGLGLEIAERLARAGAGHLVLVGRSQPNLRVLDRIATIERYGAQVVTRAVDVCDAAAVSALLDGFGSELPPLRGIVHAAGVLANRLSMQLGFDEFMAVMPSKVLGACHLHAHPASGQLDFFLSFSSLASMLGSPGQSNYAAANAFLESLSMHRNATGRAALAIAWGPWDEVGMAADEHNLARLADHGIGVVALEKGLELVEAFIGERSAGVVGALPMDWETWARGRQQLASSPYFAGLVPEEARAAANGQRIGAEDLAGLPVEAQLEMVQQALLSAVAGTMRLDPSTIELDVPLASLGLDSIVALELKERVEARLDLVVKTSSLIGGHSIAAMAQAFRKELAAVAEAPLAAAATAPVAEVPLAEVPGVDAISELSREEIEELLYELERDDDVTPSV